jgi:hypothetical protein
MFADGIPSFKPMSDLSTDPKLSTRTLSSINDGASSLGQQFIPTTPPRLYGARYQRSEDDSESKFFSMNHGAMIHPPLNPNPTRYSSAAGSSTQSLVRPRPTQLGEPKTCLFHDTIDPRSPLSRSRETGPSTGPFPYLLGNHSANDPYEQPQFASVPLLGTLGY